MDVRGIVYGGMGGNGERTGKTSRVTHASPHSKSIQGLSKPFFHNNICCPS